MAFSVRHKLALALSILSLMVCSGIYFGIRDDFSRGFNYFLNEVRINDAQKIADFIEAEFNPTRFEEFAPTRKDWRRIRHKVMQGGTVMPPEKPVDNNGRPLNRPGRHPPTPFVPIGLDFKPIFGNRVVQSSWHKVPIKGAEGVIGYIAIRPFIERENKADELFIERQHNYFFAVIFGALLISIFISWPLVFLLLKPLNQLSYTVTRISQRDYTAKSDIKSNDELGDLSKNINMLAEKLARHEQFQSEWLAQISHDLRTPTAIMLAEIEAIKDGVYPLSNQMLQSLETEIKRLDKQINDLHELSVLKCGEVPMDIKEVDVLSIIQLLAHETGTLRLSKSLIFSIFANGVPVGLNEKEISVNWSIDKEKIHRVFSNLMQNSIRYTDDPGHIKCEIIKDEKLTIIWEDSAPNVYEEDISKIFEPMFQCNKEKNFNGGSGIGLSVVAAIIKLHRGTVVVENITNGGLRFTVELP